MWFYIYLIKFTAFKEFESDLTRVSVDKDIKVLLTYFQRRLALNKIQSKTNLQNTNNIINLVSYLSVL